MRRPRTRASGAASVVCLLIALLALARALNAPSTTYEVLEGVLGGIAVLTAAKMGLHNCFESHLGAVLVAAGAVLGTLLHLTLGLPGGTGSGSLTAGSLALLLLGCAIPALLAQDARARRVIKTTARPPYAL
ncbi:hypothetical protein [Nocardioides houyundeii]|uniref:hypothetical protein n=1 Tax=Nocardioides houyundeii TaxID=2045452 RepID=UPI000DF42169|nr:hypothetical protein [Nocardioides houyundeii]